MHFLACFDDPGRDLGQEVFLTDVLLGHRCLL
jgi:hypothetical protein